MVPERFEHILNKIEAAADAFQIDLFKREDEVLQELTAGLDPCTRTTDSVIQVAMMAAAHSNAGSVATLHFVFGLLSVRNSIATQLIARAGLRGEILRKEIYNAVRDHKMVGDRSSLVPLKTASDIAPFLQYSRDSMAIAGDRRIHTGHLWTGALQLQEVSEPEGMWMTLHASDFQNTIDFHSIMPED